MTMNNKNMNRNKVNRLAISSIKKIWLSFDRHPRNII
jgi:hypothetical protein